MKFSIQLLFGFLLLAGISSCKKSNKLGLMIPKSAALAVVVNGQSVFSKLPWSEVKQNEWFKDGYQDSSMNAYVKSILDNPENTGIDYQSDIIYYLQKDSLGGFMVMEGTLKDKDKWKTFNNTLFDSPGSTRGADFAMNEKMISVTKNNQFAIIVDVPQMNRMNMMYRRNESFTPSYTRNLKGMSDTILSLKKSNTLGNDSHFSDLMESKGDISLWVNVEELNKGTLGMAALGMMNFSKLTEGSLVAAAFTFNDGKINAEVTTYGGKEMTNLYKKYEGTTIDKEMIRRVPSEKVAVLFALSFKPEGLKEFMKIAGMEGMINMGTAMGGFTFDDFIKAIKGDILFTVSDMNKDNSGRLKPNFLFSSSVNDRASFNKLIDAGNKLGKGKMSGDNPEIAYNINEKYFAIGNNKQFVDSYTSGGGASDKVFMTEFTNFPFAGYVDINYLIGSMHNEYMDSTERKMMNESVKMWDKMILTGGEFKDGGIKQHIEVRLMNKNLNSLKQLNSYLGAMGAAQKKRAMNFIPATDSIQTAPVEQH